MPGGLIEIGRHDLTVVIPCALRGFLCCNSVAQASIQRMEWLRSGWAPG